MSFLLAIKWSLGAFAVKLILGFLSMGALGAALYYLCYPILAPFYGNLNNWSGDWVWSATIWAGMLWSVSFLAAGALNLQLEGQGISAPWRGGVYLAVLWGGALAIWGLLLVTQYVPAEESRRTAPIECGNGNRRYVEVGLAAVFEPAPRLIDGPRCLKSAWNSDMVAMAELAPDFKPEGMAFSPGNEPLEAPLGQMLRSVRKRSRASPGRNSRSPAHSPPGKRVSPFIWFA
ncbi:hypothetical protein [Paracoccus kondratievae]|uniref:Uncharacterized protein n=1 Tax=Paracoccus kondratievae TaxID=135740 RepID=A0AAD3RVA9_9RHOB|nr:hypothetical protein [Paracoccus kondratievae]GLK65835.1 hypothetical protein GCM10017635_33120 [Paracoccus kondratievae]